MDGVTSDRHCVYNYASFRKKNKDRSIFQRTLQITQHILIEIR